MPPYALSNFEIQKYYQKEPGFDDVHSRNNLPKIKNGANVINLDEYKSIATHWIALYMNGNNATYLGSYGVGCIPNKKNSYVTKIAQQMFIKYKYLTHKCVDTFVLDLLIL